MEDQPNRGDLERLSPWRIKQLEDRKLIDTHKRTTKLGGSSQDIWMDKRTGELWVASKFYAQQFESLEINPRDLGVPGF